MTLGFGFEFGRKTRRHSSEALEAIEILEAFSYLSFAISCDSAAAFTNPWFCVQRDFYA